MLLLFLMALLLLALPVECSLVLGTLILLSLDTLLLALQVRLLDALFERLTLIFFTLLFL